MVLPAPSPIEATTPSITPTPSQPKEKVSFTTPTRIEEIKEMEEFMELEPLCLVPLNKIEDFVDLDPMTFNDKPELSEEKVPFFEKMEKLDKQFRNLMSAIKAMQAVLTSPPSMPSTSTAAPAVAQ
jgi:hypothetical protein